MSTKEELLARLDAICFHDIPVGKISFEAGSSNEFMVDFFLYNEEKKDYDNFTIRFIDISYLKTDELALDSESNLEITSFDYEWNDLFEGEIIFLLGFGQPSFAVELTCRSVELICKLTE